MSYLGDLGTFLKGEREGVTLELDNKLNAIAPYSGYLAVSKKLDNFYFKTGTDFIASMADKNRYVKFLDKVVDTWGDNLITNGDFSAGTTGWTARNGATLTVENGMLKVYESDGSSTARATKGFVTVVGKVYTISVYKEKGNDVATSAISNNADGSSAFLVDSSISGGVWTATFVATATTTYISLSVGNGVIGRYCYFDNISVKEIQSINLSNYIPGVLVQEEATNGLTLQSSVNAGDYVVVDRKELVTNGTFDTDTSGWTASNCTLSVVNGAIRLTATSTNACTAYQNIATIAGKKYTLKLTHLASGNNNGDIIIGSAFGTDNIYNGADYTVGVEKQDVITFTALTTLTSIQLRGLSPAVGEFIDFDNISVKQLDETYRAKIDAPIGTSLTNTTYFEVRDSIGVTNQIGVFHKYNVLTNSYEGLSAEILFSDVSKEDLLDNPTWLARNGFSKAGEYCYSKGTYLYLPVSIWQTLNKGAYHPVFNGFGVAKFADSTNGTTYDQGDFWYENSTTNAKAITVSGCFSSIVEAGQITDGLVHRYSTSGAISRGLSARPDSKYYDIVYPDQVIDIREYAKMLNKYEVDLIRADKEENGVEEVVSLLSIKGNRYYKRGIGGLRFYQMNLFTGFDFAKKSYDITFINLDDNTFCHGKNITINSGTIELDLYDVSVVNQNHYTYSNLSGATETTIYPTNGVQVMLIRCIPVLSSNTKLSTDLIGNPMNYPSIMLNRLAEGKGIIGVNPLLVGQDGTNYSVGGTLNPIYSSKLINVFNALYTDNGTTYVSYAPTVNFIANTFGLTYSAPRILLHSYTSKNLPYIQTTPKAVVEVLPKVKASNSHSIYKGALVGNQVAGKIQVGNGSNDYESKVLEKTEVTYDYVARNDTYVPLAPNNTYLIGTSGVGDGTYKVGQVVKYTGTTTLSSWLPNPTSFTDGGQLLGYTDLVPTHSTIALDNSNSPASKWFECLEEGSNGVLAGVYGKELVWDYDVDNTDDFIHITTQTQLVQGSNYYLDGTQDVFGQLAGKYITLVQPTVTYGDGDWQNFIVVNNEVYYKTIYDSNGVRMRVWDGNGFGDNDTFDQLTNGTKTDINGNTVRTFHGSIAINGRIK